MYKIYGILFCPENRIIYVGQTGTDLENRFYAHITSMFKKMNTKLSNFMKQHRIHDFDIIELEGGIKEAREADRREQYWINYYDTYNNGYNGSIGGNGPTKLTFDQKDEILNLYDNATPIKQIANKFNQNPPSIRYILRSYGGHNILYRNGLQEPPFYINIPLPWDIDLSQVY